MAQRPRAPTKLEVAITLFKLVIGGAVSIIYPTGCGNVCDIWLPFMFAHDLIFMVRLWWIRKLLRQRQDRSPDNAQIGELAGPPQASIEQNLRDFQESNTVSMPQSSFTEPGSLRCLAVITLL